LSSNPPIEAILIAHCEDQSGIVAKISNWVFLHQGNILALDQHVDSLTGRFFIRIRWDLKKFKIAKEQLEKQFMDDLAKPLGMSFEITYTDHVPKMAIFVSKLGHCLWDLLGRYKSGELKAEIPMIVSNHTTYQSLCERFGIPFYHFPVTQNNKAALEKEELELLKSNNVDLIVLARYMQVLSPEFVDHYPDRIINIHHSFLPAFPGAKPYHQAHSRGVKLIGATAHYVTSELDEGPIIEQDTIRVSHRDKVKDLVSMGCDLEKIIFSRAVKLHLNKQVAVHGNRTLIFV
jgi:formyltetrahydrofolate deformylase